MITNSLFQFLKSSSYVLAENVKVVSSAKSLVLSLEVLGRSFIYNENSKGPKMDP